MRTTSYSAVAALKFAVYAVLFQTGITHAAEIKLLSANGIKASMEDLGPKFEKASGHKLTIIFEGGGAIEKKVRGGEAIEIIIIPKWNVDNLVKDGKVVAAAPIARSGIGVAIRKGAPRPDISSADAFKRTLLAAKSVAFNAPEGSGSGTHFSKVMDQLGIAREMKPKSVLTSSGGVGAAVAGGKAELGVTQLSSFVGVAGVEVVGPLPGNLQNTTVYTAASPANAKNADAVKALVAFLRGAEAAKVYKAKGMEPG